MLYVVVKSNMLRWCIGKTDLNPWGTFPNKTVSAKSLDSELKKQSLLQNLEYKV